MSLGKSVRRSDIEGLRGIAIFFIVFFHAFPHVLAGGYAGVSVFFTLAGYFAMQSIERLGEKYSGWRLPYEFVYGRAKRLIFPYWLMILAALVIAFFIALPVSFRVFRNAALSALAFISNFYFREVSTYFGPGSFENPFLHTWFLSIQMQMFVLLALVFGWGARRWRGRIAWVLLVVLSAVSMALLIAKGKDYTYYTTFARIPEFLLGVVAYSVHATLSARINVSERLCSIVSAVSLVVILAACVLCSATTLYAGAVAFAPSVATVGLLLFGGGVVRKVLSWRGLVYVGSVSYEFFLIHWPILALLRYRFNVPVIPLWVGLIALVAGFGLSICFRWLMQRVNAGGRPIAVYARNAVVGMLVVVCGVGLVRANKQIYGEMLNLMTSSAFGLTSHASRHFMGADTLGNLTSKRTIFLMGNSHALTMKRYFDLFGKRYGYRVITISINSVPNLPALNDEQRRALEDLDQYERVMVPTLQIVPQVDAVVIASRPDEIDYTANVKTLRSLMRKEAPLLLLQPYLVSLIDIVRENGGVLKPKDGAKFFEKVKESWSEGVKEYAQREKNVAMVNLWRDEDFPDWPFCNDTLMYYDGGHLNIYGSEKYFEKTGERMEEALQSVFAAMKE